MNIKRLERIVIAIWIAAALLLTAATTYRVIMKAARVDVAGDVVYITVFGRTDVYSAGREEVESYD